MNLIEVGLTEEKVKAALGKAMSEAVDIYVEGKDSIARKTITIGHGGERYMFAIWPGDIVDLQYACSTLTLTDIGDRIASFDAGYFNMDQIAKFTIEMIKTLEGIED